MHRGGLSYSREAIVKQVEKGESSVHDFSSYVPIGNAVRKLVGWNQQEATLYYLTSRRESTEIAQIQKVLNVHSFPKGQLLYRTADQEYLDIAERLCPDLLIEDDCESIGGAENMVITKVDPAIRANISSIPVKEFGGIDHLPNDLRALQKR